MWITITEAVVTRIGINFSGGKAATAACDYTVTDSAGNVYARTYTWELAPADVTNVDSLLGALIGEMEQATGLTVAVQ